MSTKSGRGNHESREEGEVEKSFAMFASIIGTWLPFSLIFLSTFLTSLYQGGNDPDRRLMSSQLHERQRTPGRRICSRGKTSIVAWSIRGLGFSQNPIATEGGPAHG
jgi:hypothetical protein